MRNIITGIFIIVLSVVTSQAAYAVAVGKFVKVEGRVDITRPGKPAELVNVGTEIFEKDIIRSKSNSKAEILFSDGNVLRLAQKTRVEVSEYISDSNRRSTILNLFRGKIQNKVKKLFGSIFGDDKNRYEVHTRTSVCGVRGTDFFMSYQNGVSGATFKEGFGYVYNINRPDNVLEVQAGQSMIISGPNASPIVRSITREEINRHEEETTPAEEESLYEEGSSGEEEGITGESAAEEAESNESERPEPGVDSNDDETGGGFEPDASIGDPMLADSPEENNPPADNPFDPIAQEFNDPYIPPEISVSKPGISGQLMGLVYGRHYEGEFILPRSTDPHRSGYTGRIEEATYRYDYFLMNDGITYLRGSAESEITDTDTWTMYNYLPDGTLVTETGGADGFIPQITESSWGGSLAFLANPPSAAYISRFSPNPFDTTIITGIGSFEGEILGMSSGIWSTTETAPIDISFEGQYTSPGNPVTLFRSRWSGSYDGGTYFGFFSGDEANARGLVHALYINPEGTEVGILKTEFTGLVDNDGNWDSTMYSVQVPGVTPATPGSVTNANFLASIGNGKLEVERLTGSFSGSNGTTIKAHGFGNTSYLLGHDWGIFDLAFGYAKYDENAVSSSWAGSISGFGAFGGNDGGMWFADITGDEWGPNGIRGTLNGKFITMTQVGTIEGNLIGPDGISGDWTAVSQGTWQKTNDLQFSSRLDGSLFLIRPEEGGSYWMSGNDSTYSYHYDLYSHEGGFHFYNAGNGTDTYMQINAWDFDGTVADFYRQDWIYNHATYAYIGYSSVPATGFILQNLRDNPGLYTGGITWENHDPWTSYNMFNTGWFEGILGGLDNPWSATSTNPADITLLGFYEVPFYVTSSQPVIFAIDIESQNSIGGAYSGFMGGVLGSSTRGNIYAIYINPGNNAGVLIGDFQGSADLISGIWEAGGGIYPVQLFSSIGETPTTLLNSVEETPYHFWDNNSMYTSPGGDGSFYNGSGTAIGDFEIGGGQLFNKKITGQSWGVWQNVIGGAYSGTPGNNWTMNLHHEMWDESTGNISGIIAKYGVSGGTWSGNRIEADVLGAWVDLSDVVVGVSSGKISGTYDPTQMTWQTAGAGAWIRTDQFIDMATTTAGRATLAGLNIPAIEIGRTTLSGTGSTISVTMTDVTFFASSTGGNPRIWATDNISGTYSVTPYMGDYVYMTDSNRTISAELTVKNWDNNRWAADISNGNGTLNRSDVAGTANVQFSGVAGGAYTGTTSGSFSGEGAGVVR